jgi:excisionase family DNA binding protein
MNHLTSRNDLTRNFFEAMADAIVQQLEHVHGRKKRVYNIEQAAEYLGISTNGVYDLLNTRRLPTVSIDSRNRFDVRDLDKFVDENKKWVGP